MSELSVVAANAEIKKLKEKRNAKIGKFLRRYGTILALVLVCIFFACMTPKFASINNAFTVVRQIAPLAILSLGLTFVMITGRSDLSIGYTTSFMGIVVAALMVNAGLPMWIAVILALVIGGIIGMCNGIAVAFIGIPDFIATLGFGYLVSGLNQWYTKGYPISGMPSSFDFFGIGKIAGFPVAIVILIILFIVFTVIVNKTRFGRHIYAIGDNEEATMMSGINTKFNIMLTYVVCGIAAAVTAVVLSSKLGNANPLAGESYLLEAIAAVYLGSTAFKDGQPNLKGTVLGALIIGIMSNGLTLLNVAYYYQDIATGLIIIVAVTVNAVQKIRKR